MKQNKIFNIYLITISILGSLGALVITNRYGPGLSTDGARYLSSAENLLNGLGLIDYLGVPLTQFPPLYSLLIAITSLLTTADVFIAAKYLNIFAFGITIWLSGIYFKRLFPANHGFAYIGATVMATSVSLLRIASNVLSDLLFLALTIGFLMLASDFTNTPSQKKLLLLGFVCALSPFLRYAGLTFILTVSILILLNNTLKIVSRVVQAALFAILTSLPILCWVYLHNFLMTGILFGVRRPPSIAGNLDTTLEKAVHWFVPFSVVERIPEWMIIVLLILFFSVGSRASDWRAWGKMITGNVYMPNLIFILLYTAVLIFNVSYSEVRWPFMDRIHIIILPSLMALGFLTIQSLPPRYIKQLPTGTLRYMIIVGFIIWLIYPLNNIQKYLLDSLQNGESSEYNIYNTAALNESGINDFMRSIPLQSSDKIYSNFEPLAWFYTRRMILKLPQDEVGNRNPDPHEVLKNYPDWPGRDGGGYVLWFKGLGFKRYILSPEQLQTNIHIERIFNSDPGDVYRITPR